MVAKYGAGNDYNIDGADNQALLGHFARKQTLSPDQLRRITESVEGSFFQTLEGRTQQSVFGRYINQDRLRRLLEKRFPT